MGPPLSAIAQEPLCPEELALHPGPLAAKVAPPSALPPARGHQQVLGTGHGSFPPSSLQKAALSVVLAQDLSCGVRLCRSGGQWRDSPGQGVWLWGVPPGVSWAAEPQFPPPAVCPLPPPDAPAPLPAATEAAPSSAGEMADTPRDASLKQPPMPRNEKAPVDFGYVGIDSILEQMRRKAMKQGFEFNIMVVGESPAPIL